MLRSWFECCFTMTLLFGLQNMLAVDDISAHVPSTNASDAPGCPTGFVLLNMVGRCKLRPVYKVPDGARN
jgi:hypothetical protein